MRIIVVHTGYGCDTGCCGHIVMVDDEQRGRFHFHHPHEEDHHEFVKRLVTEHCGKDHVKDIDWLNCVVVED